MGNERFYYGIIKRYLVPWTIIKIDGNTANLSPLYLESNKLLEETPAVKLSKSGHVN